MPTWHDPLPTFTDGVAPSAADLNKLLDNMEWLHAPPADKFEYSGANLTTTSTTWASIGASWEKTIVTSGGYVLLLLAVQVRFLYIDIEVDGARLGHATTGLGTYAGSFQHQIYIPRPIFNLAAGSHTFKAMWARNTAGTPGTLFADQQPRFYVREMR